MKKIKKPLIILINQKFGRWTIIDNKPKTDKEKLLCRCDCGTIRYVRRYQLLNSLSISCGCYQKEITGKKLTKNLINKRFGKLIVLERLKNDKSQRTKWKCKCDCGKETIVTSHDLNRKDGKGTKSCGCLLKEKNNNRLYKGTKDINGKYFTSIINGAKARKIVFDLTIEYLQKLLEEQNYRCVLSGLPINGSQNTNKNASTYIEMTASLDRIDSSQGYIIGNVQWVHKDVNFMKQDFSEKEFLELCGKIWKNKTSRVKGSYHYNEEKVLHETLQKLEEDNLQQG